MTVALVTIVLRTRSRARAVQQDAGKIGVWQAFRRAACRRKLIGEFLPVFPPETGFFPRNCPTG